MPLLPRGDAPEPIRDLNPVFDVAGAPHVMLTQAIATVPTRAPGRAVASLADRRDAVTRALDILLTGY